ncbi:hypothetical protein CC2G_006792 [Coprinopsis cinerea AmutBmut pab1-1]|nr:hypothetical protein CC2G_006792 [Coprinopsis cinerea AmutBmut pab1-1]
MEALLSTKYSGHEGIRRAFETEADLGLWREWASLDRTGSIRDDCNDCEEGPRGNPLHDYPACNSCFNSDFGMDFCSFHSHYLEHMLMSQFYTPVHEIPLVLAEYSRLNAHLAELEDASPGTAGLDGKLWEGLKQARALVEKVQTNGERNTSTLNELDKTLVKLQAENLRVMAGCQDKKKVDGYVANCEDGRKRTSDQIGGR